MTYCISIESGLWAFLGVLAVLCGLALVGIGIVAVAERRQRLRKVQVRGAVRVGPRLFPKDQAANDSEV